MGASLVTASTVEPVSLAMAKEFLKIDASDRDAEIAIMLLASRRFVEGYTRRVLAPETWDFTYDYEWPRSGSAYRIDPPMLPVISVTSITYVDADGAAQVLAADQYQVAGTGSDGRMRIVPAYNVTWPEVRCQPEAITVRCYCGYEFGSPAIVNIPQDLILAILFDLEISLEREPQMRQTLTERRDALMSPYRLIRL